MLSKGAVTFAKETQNTNPLTHFTQPTISTAKSTLNRGGIILIGLLANGHTFAIKIIAITIVEKCNSIAVMYLYVSLKR